MKEWVWSIVDRKIIQELFMSNTIDLTLDGLSCGHCVKRVKVLTLSKQKSPSLKPM